MALLDTLHIEADCRNRALTDVSLTVRCQREKLSCLHDFHANDTGVCLLNREFAALERSCQIGRLRSLLLDIGTHRQNSQQRRLACILQSDHGYVHLSRPTLSHTVSSSFGRARRP